MKALVDRLRLRLVAGTASLVLASGYSAAGTGASPCDNPFAMMYQQSTATLIECLSSTRRTEAFRELVDRGVDALPALSAELGRSEWRRRCEAAFVLSQIGVAARPSAAGVQSLVHEISTLSEAPESFTCRSVGGYLRRLDPARWESDLSRAVRTREAALCRTLLTGSSFPQHEEVPRAVFDALDVPGCSAAAADLVADLDALRWLPAMIRAAAHPSVEVRRRLLEDLADPYVDATAGDRRPWRRPLIRALERALADPDHEVRKLAAEAFGSLGPDAAPAVRALGRALGDPDLDVRRRAADALASIGPEGRSVGPSLLRARDAAASESGAEALQEALALAIEATGAAKDDAQLAREDEVLAAAVAHHMSSSRGKLRWTVKVAGLPPRPGLLRLLRARGISTMEFEANDCRCCNPLELSAVRWLAADRAEATVTTGWGEGIASGTYHLAPVGKGWQVVATVGGYIT